MFSSARDFVRSQGGSMLPMMALLAIPLLLAVGFSVDYTSAVTTRSNMQQALDAAILSITTLPTTTSKADRQTALQQAYVANSGLGDATLTAVNVAADGTAMFSATAAYQMPTSFMQIARINSVDVGVGSSVRKMPALVQSTFKVTKVSGYWNKTMTLYGTQFGQTKAKPLMTISYNYNGYGDPKGYGTTTVSTINGSTTTVVQKQVCTTSTVDNFNNLPNGAITQTSGSNKYVTTCADTFYPANGAGAVIDVSQMDQLYLQMDVPSGNPKVLKSNDPNTSNRLYIGSSQTNMPEVATGQKVDIFTSVPCGQTGYQAWEDGGNPVPAPVSNADFFYNVTGKCAFNQRPSETVLTQ
ncbi:MULTISPECIES: pilus assembly protein TadG-related protein [unclassified Mesorhizobium]|uniref:TadE/TadG family type IV pilus assembly protein n=1 Tax=unclassified Mesorhizobium TaxID=325217 RepID=UPI0024157E5A|nr:MULTISPECIES: pilus assembly protein TadG-related protein [unclassified Mesorhizobium]MDG4853402.1 pilus assembly protein TadG-related protein [Mesorhizobium sp. WSM4982]MDG4913370.1 pilus assembly protein TadG-related protein [Mesorhizobium sp. WSM4983]